MNTGHRQVLALLLVSALPPACKKNATASIVEQEADPIIEALCTRFEVCAPQFGKPFSSREACRFWSSWVLTGGCAAAEFAGTPDEIAACPAVIEQLPCEVTFNTYLPNLFERWPCPGVSPTGSRHIDAPGATGERCETVLDCPADDYCPHDQDDVPPLHCAVCTPRIAAGDPCTGLWAGECVESASCTGDGLTSGSCVTKADIDQACAQDRECLSGWCDAVALRCRSPLPRGAPCQWPHDVCVGYLGCWGSVCTDAPSPGQSCLLTHWACTSDSVCIDGYCVSGSRCGEGALGDACFVEDACEEGAYCDGGELKCSALSGVGGSCTADDYCLPPLVCGGPDSHTCSRLGGLDAPCHWDHDCVPELTCVAGGAEALGSCEPRVEVNGSCANGESCARNAYCDGSLCQLLLPDDASCNSSVQCASGYCVAWNSATFTCAEPEACLASP